MARIRTIKPDFFTDERLVKCSLAAAYLYAGLWCHVDDAGFMLYSPHRIGGWIFTGRPEALPDRVEQLIGELQEHGRVFLFELEERQYLWIPHFLRHQRINNPSLTRCCMRADPTGKLKAYALPKDVQTSASRNGQRAGEVFLVERSEAAGTPTTGLTEMAYRATTALHEPSGSNDASDTEEEDYENSTVALHDHSYTGKGIGSGSGKGSGKGKRVESSLDLHSESDSSLSINTKGVSSSSDTTAEEPKTPLSVVPPYTENQNLNTSPKGNPNELNELTTRIMSLLNIQENKLIWDAVRASIQLKASNAHMSLGAAAQRVASAALETNATARPANWLYWFRDGRYDEPAPRVGASDAWMVGKKPG